MRPLTCSTASSVALQTGTDSAARELGELGGAALHSGGSPTRSDARSLESDAAANGGPAPHWVEIQGARDQAAAAEEPTAAEGRYSELATAALLRAVLREEDGGGAAGAEQQALAGVLGVERGRNRLQQAQLRDSIARQSLRLQVLEEQERRMGVLQAGLAETASLPGGLAGRLDEVLQVVQDMNETRRFGGISQQQIAGAIVHKAAGLQVQDSYRFDGAGGALSLQQMLAAFVRGDAGRVALRSSMQSCPFVMPLQQVGCLSFEAYSGLHASYLREVGLALASGQQQALTSLAHELMLLRLAFAITRWETFLRFREANVAATPPATLQAAAAGAAVEAGQAAALHALWRRHSAAQAEAGARDAQARAAVRAQLREFGAAPARARAPFARLLGAAEALAAAGHARTLAQIEFNLRAAMAVLRPRQMGALLAACAPHHLRLDLLLAHGCIPAPAQPPAAPRQP